MNQARNRRRSLALFRYEHATAHAGQARPGLPWITWRPVCRSITCPPLMTVQLAGDLPLTPEQLSAYVGMTVADLNRVFPLPDGYEMYWDVGDGSATSVITARDGSVVYAATTDTPVQLGGNPPPLDPETRERLDRALERLAAGLGLAPDELT